MAPVVSDSRLLYDEMKLKGVVNYVAFEQTMIGYNEIGERHNSIVTLIDFSKPSTEKRFYVFDIQQKQLLFSSYVSHGKNSGENYAVSFSNKSGSYKSSLGFYLTEHTYYGRNGYSLILNGLEKGINDHARARAIVIHGASYSDPSVIARTGRLGRSYGCPALPESVSKLIIDTIKDGSLLFIYANNQDYRNQSGFLSRYKTS